MTDEVRRHIACEHYYHGRKFTKIADELGIKKQAISNDRRLHKEAWEKEREWLEVLIKREFDK